MYWSMDFQTPSSSLAVYMSAFHDYVFIFVVSLTIFIMMLLWYLMLMNPWSANLPVFSADIGGSISSIEVLGIAKGFLIVGFLVGPSLCLLYATEDFSSSWLKLKVVGHQWYWSYSTNNFDEMYDSYLDRDLSHIRLMGSSSPLSLPASCGIQAFITSEDVIHSWTMPTNGVKSDATPGRLTSLAFIMDRVGMFWGQCSEICGANHSFMPIVVESMPIEHFLFV